MTRRLTVIFGLLTLTLIAAQNTFANKKIEDAGRKFAATDETLELLMKEWKLGEKPTPLTTVSSTTLKPDGSPRKFQRVVLTGPHLRRIQLLINFPADMPVGARLPVVVVFGGLQTGSNTIRFLADPGDNILIGYDYPLAYSLAPSNLTEANEKLGVIPAQMASLLGWTAQQSWADKEHINTVAISFGGFFLPVAQRVAQVQGTNVYSTVIAYSGDVSPVVQAALDGQVGHREMNIIKSVLNVVLAPLSPSSHVGYLQTKLLFVNGTEDELIPRVAVEHMHQAAVHKTVKFLKGPHINTDQEELIEQFNFTLADWLKEQSAIR